MSKVLCRFGFISLFLSTLFQAHALTFYAEDLPPYHFKNAQGNASGALVEITKAALKHADLEGEFSILPMARAYKELQERPDALMLSLLRTAEREAHFTWISQTYFADAYLVSLASNPVNPETLSAAQRFRVSTIRGYSSARFLQQAGFSEDDNLVLVGHYKQLWQLLYKQRIDLVLTNTLTLQNEIIRSGLNPELIEKKLHLTNFPSQLWLCASKQLKPEIAAKLSTAMAYIKTSGVYEQILMRWQLPLPQSDK
ncbi:transporter substrate-binding domain-containing protein [Pseudoalteromonas sp. JBTF-M23]|uniref:Transporter substrate-binding domain-containing protein n=1 Tax=Pseudoalteromonas caenipelagi TaxID=2726988 RepID=A0A849VFV5_9GAMM|nr:transporter substrate-binding domain-containing protein [Pseudoalteromonas caenipelagi]NOU52609.1 transporter substrate-binding domain-containing protein [Pseudoalteromonas caenipelagi]